MSFTKRAALAVTAAAAAAILSAGVANAAPATDIHGRGHHHKQYRDGGKHQGWKRQGLDAKVRYLINHPDRAARHLDRAVKRLLQHGSA